MFDALLPVGSSQVVARDQQRVALLRWNLFTYRDLRQWLDNPFTTPPGAPDEDQLSLPIPALGQQAQRKPDNLKSKPVKSVPKTVSCQEILS